MPKPTRGLPASFSIDVPEGLVREPVQLGDYFDDQVAPAPVSARALPTPATQSRTPAPPSAPPNLQRVPHPQRPPIAEPIEAAEPVPHSPALSSFVRRVSRKQLNLNPETLRMVDELLHHIQIQSVQKDAKASEMFHALVAALYDARELLSLANVPPRGRWGTPTAYAFPVALKNAFQAAIADWFRRSNS